MEASFRGSAAVLASQGGGTAPPGSAARPSPPRVLLGGAASLGVLALPGSLKLPLPLSALAGTPPPPPAEGPGAPAAAGPSSGASADPRPGGGSAGSTAVATVQCRIRTDGLVAWVVANASVVWRAGALALSLAGGVRGPGQGGATIGGPAFGSGALSGARVVVRVGPSAFTARPRTPGGHPGPHGHGARSPPHPAPSRGHAPAEAAAAVEDGSATVVVAVVRPAATGDHHSVLAAAHVRSTSARSLGGVAIDGSAGAISSGRPGHDAFVVGGHGIGLDAAAALHADFWRGMALLRLRETLWSKRLLERAMVSGPRPEGQDEVRALQSRMQEREAALAAEAAAAAALQRRLAGRRGSADSSAERSAAAALPFLSSSPGSVAGGVGPGPGPAGPMAGAPPPSPGTLTERRARRMGRRVGTRHRHAALPDATSDARGSVAASRLLSGVASGGARAAGAVSGTFDDPAAPSPGRAATSARGEGDVLSLALGESASEGPSPVRGPNGGGGRWGGAGHGPRGPPSPRPAGGSTDRRIDALEAAAVAAGSRRVGSAGPGLDAVRAAVSALEAAMTSSVPKALRGPVAAAPPAAAAGPPLLALPPPPPPLPSGGQQPAAPVGLAAAAAAHAAATAAAATAAAPRASERGTRARESGRGASAWGPEGPLLKLATAFGAGASVLLDLGAAVRAAPAVTLGPGASVPDLDDHAALLVDPSCPDAVLYVGFCLRRDGWTARAEVWSRWQDITDGETAGIVAVVAKAAGAVSARPKPSQW